MSPPVVVIHEAGEAVLATGEAVLANVEGEGKEEFWVGWRMTVFFSPTQQVARCVNNALPKAWRGM